MPGVGAGIDPPLVTAEMNSSTPLGLGQTVMQLVLSAAIDLNVSLPTERWTQLGVPVMTCSSVAVGIMSTREVALYDGNIQCGSRLQADVTVGIVRECSIEHDVSGHTIPALAEANAVLMSGDAEVLALAASLMPGKTSGQSTQFVVEGGLALVTMLVSSEVVVW